MQTLYAKGPDGKSREVHVHRSFHDISGVNIYLHTNGTYGYKDGSPVRSESELQGLPPEHRTFAMAWWKRIGEKASIAYYATLAEKSAKHAGDFQEALAADVTNSALDSILYARRAMKNGKKAGAISAPKSWMEYDFNARPDWWGQAKTIGFPDFAYEMQDPASEEQIGDLDPAAATSEEQTGA